MLPSLLIIILGSLLAQSAQGYDSPQAIVTVSSEQLQDLISAQMEKHDIRGHLQNLPLRDTFKNGMSQQRGGLFPILSGVVNNVLGNILDLRISKVAPPTRNLLFDERRQFCLLGVGADLELEIKMPLHLGRLVYLNLHLAVEVDVQLQRSLIDNSMQMVVGNCRDSPGHLRLSVLNNKMLLTQVVNNLLGTMTDVAEKTVPSLLQRDLCPLVNGVLRSVMQLLQGSLASEVHEKTIRLTPTNYVFQNGAVELDYQGTIRLPGGQTLYVPSGPSPLLPAPLDRSPMNILLSSNLLNTILGAYLPPQAVNLSPQEVAAFIRVEALRSMAPKAASIRALQISHGIPALVLGVGSIQAQQAIEVKAFGDLQGRTALLFNLGATVHLSVGVAAVSGRLTLTFALASIDTLSVISSSAPHHHANLKSLMQPIAELVSGSLLPHQNQLLSGGFQLPMARELGVSTFSISAGQDALRLSVPPHSVDVQVEVVH